MSNPAEFRKWIDHQFGRRADNFYPGDLQYIANGPLCDPAKIYCPAGRLSWAETKEREAAQLVSE